jgi:uncharacterized protein YbjT (DUF2867 family)
MKILVIGGTGFIGTRVLGELCRQGHRLAVLHRGTKAAELPERTGHWGLFLPPLPFLARNVIIEMR